MTHSPAVEHDVNVLFADGPWRERQTLMPLAVEIPVTITVDDDHGATFVYGADRARRPIVGTRSALYVLTTRTSIV